MTHHILPAPARPLTRTERNEQDEYSILNSRHSIGIHGYMLVYSVTSKQSFEMVRIIRDKVLNHLVCIELPPYLPPRLRSSV